MANYSSFRPEASVDWVELVVSPARQTNWRTVQGAILQATGKTVDVRTIDRGGFVNPYSQSVSDEWVKNSPAFKFSLQDAARFIDIDRVISQIKERLKCEITTTVTGIEVAFDIIGAGAEVAAAMYQGLKNPVSDNHRVYRKSGDFVNAAAKQTTAALVSHLQAGWMIGIGNETDDLYQRIYFKTTDRNGSVNQIRVEPRARIEIRLMGAELPFSTLEQLREFKFTSLSKYFLFRCSASPSNARGADKELNGRAGDAIQRLSRSWPTVGKSTKPTKKKSADFRHCQQGERQESGTTKTTASPDSKREQPQPEARASEAHCGDSLITCQGSNETGSDPDQQEVSKASIDSQDEVSFADLHLSSLGTDSPLEDTALEKSLKTIADERTETRNKVSSLTAVQEAKQSEQPDT